MTRSEWARLGVVDLAEAVRSGRATATGIVDHQLARIAERNPPLGAFVMVDEERARQTAAAVDRVVADGADPGPLAGVPFGVKELEDVEGWPHTLASKVFAERRATTTSTQVSRLLAAGAVPVGLTASPELGTASHTASLLNGVCRSPWDRAKTPGGSSGGSAAAVAAGLVPMATGSDSGGSLRIPAAYSGLVGFKGTYGRVPRGPNYVGLPNVRHYGVLTRSVADAGRVLDVVCGADEHDPLSLPRPPYSFEHDPATVDLDGLRVAFSADLGFGVCEPAIAELARAAADELAAVHRWRRSDVPVDLPDTAEAWVVLGTPDVLGLYGPHYPARADEIAPFLVDMLARGRELEAADVAAAAVQRDRLVHALAEVFSAVDLLITPTVACPAFAAEGPAPDRIDGRPVELLDTIGQTYAFNMSGHPAVSVPLGMVDGAPVGLQIAGRRHDDLLVLAAAGAWEQLHPWPGLAPGY